MNCDFQTTVCAYHNVYGKILEIACFSNTKSTQTHTQRDYNKK